MTSGKPKKGPYGNEITCQRYTDTYDRRHYLPTCFGGRQYCQLKKHEHIQISHI